MALLHEILVVHHAVLPENGEDSFALRSQEQGAFLCVADGCGGLGSKRYAALENRTGAYLAARLAVNTFAEWMENHPSPQNDSEADVWRVKLENALNERFKSYADSHCREESSRITGTMQRRLPTTFCALTETENKLCFCWAGDSRGYVMDANGLHQYTRDHLRGGTDAFETLYCDAPLSNLISADKPGKLESRMIDVSGPCVVLLATDGVYSSLPTPMEMEMLLLDTLRKAGSSADWERKLHYQIARNAQDDATLLTLIRGYDSFDQLKANLLVRRDALQKQFITPVRRRRGDLAYARQKWLQYKCEYDRTETGHE